MQKYILFIFSIILCTCSLSAQLKEKVASLTRSLNNLQKFISKPSGLLPTLPSVVQEDMLRLIFMGTINTAEKLKNFLEFAYNIKLTNEQAEEFYKISKTFLKKRDIELLLPVDIVKGIHNQIISGLIKSPEDVQKSLKAQGYSIVTLKQAQELYNKLPSIPSMPPPPLTLKTITADEAFKLIEKNLKLKGGLKIDYRSIDGIMQYLGSLGYIVPSKLAEEIKKLFETRLIEESGIKTPRTSRTRPVEVTAVAAIKALDDAGKKFKSKIQIIDFLNSKKLYPTIPKEREELEGQLERFIQ